MAKKPAEPRPPGRPTKCTPETQAVIIEALRRGNYAVVAARLAGIDEQTFYNWVAAGEKGQEPYAAFLGSVKSAEAEAEKEALETVRAGATGFAAVNWTSAMTFLERRWPDRWGKRDPHRQELAALEKRNKELEIALNEAKLSALKAGVGDGAIEPLDPESEAFDRKMRERFGTSPTVYKHGEGK